MSEYKDKVTSQLSFNKPVKAHSNMNSSINDNRELFVNQRNLINGIIQRAVHYTQPKTPVFKESERLTKEERDIKMDHGVLSGKCFAYSVFNAIKEVNPAFNWTQAEVDKWIKDNLTSRGTGGNARLVWELLTRQGVIESPGAEEKKNAKDFLAFTTAAFEKKEPIFIGVKFMHKQVEKSKHWIYGIKVDAGKIIAKDQQNNQFGEIEFTKTGPVWNSARYGTSRNYWYQITQIQVGQKKKTEEELTKHFK